MVQLNIFNFFYNHNYLWIILFIFARFMGAMSQCPLFASNYISYLLRASLSLLLSLYSYKMFNNITIQNELVVNLVLIIANYLYGFILGFMFSFPLWLIESCGNLIDNQRGEQMGAIINKLTNNPASSIGSLLSKTFLAYFVVNNGFLFFFDTLYNSFHVFPLSSLLPIMSAEKVVLYIGFLKSYFYWVIVLVLPVSILMLLIDLLLGLISSFIPQINVTVMSMPIKSSVAILLLSLFLGVLFHNVFTKIFINTFKILY